MAIFAKLLSQWEDRRLVAAFLKQRDEHAFRRLYRAHTPRLYQTVLRLVQYQKHEAEEVVQDTWVRAVERLPSFRWEARLQTWLVGIAVNRCRELFRERQRQRNEFAPEKFEESLPARDGDMHVQIDLECALAALPHGYREVFVLHDISGYTHEEIGAMLSLNTGTSKSQLFHARQALRAALRDLSQTQ